MMNETIISRSDALAASLSSLESAVKAVASARPIKVKRRSKKTASDARKKKKKKKAVKKKVGRPKKGRGRPSSTIKKKRAAAAAKRAAARKKTLNEDEAIRARQRTRAKAKREAAKKAKAKREAAEEAAARKKLIEERTVNAERAARIIRNEERAAERMSVIQREAEEQRVAKKHAIEVERAAARKKRAAARKRRKTSEATLARGREEVMAKLNRLPVAVRSVTKNQLLDLWYIQYKKVFKQSRGDASSAWKAINEVRESQEHRVNLSDLRRFYRSKSYQGKWKGNYGTSNFFSDALKMYWDILPIKYKG